MKRFATLAAFLAAVLMSGMASAGHGGVTHASGGGKTNEGRHFDFNVFPETDRGHLKVSAVDDDGNTLRLVCRGRTFKVKGETYDLMFAVFDSTHRLQNRGGVFTQLEGSVLVWAECVDRNTGTVYMVDVGLHDLGEGKNDPKDRICAIVRDLKTHDLVSRDCGPISNGNVQTQSD